MMRRTSAGGRRALVALAIGALVFWLRHDLVAASALLRSQLSLTTGAGIVLFTLVHFLNEPLRWWVLLRTEYPNATLPRTYHALTATALASYLFPARLGMPVRIMMAKRVLQLEYATTGGLLVVDATINYGAWGTAALAGAFMVLPGSGLATPAVALVGVVAAAVAVLVVARRKWLVNGRAPAAARFVAALHLLSVPAALINVLLLAVDILSYGIRHSLILVALGVNCPLLSVTLVVAMSMVAGFVSLMPLGLGAYDVSLVLLLTMLGVPREAAVAVPLINRIATMSIGTLLGAISAAHLGLRPGAAMTSVDFSTVP